MIWGRIECFKCNQWASKRMLHKVHGVLISFFTVQILNSETIHKVSNMDFSGLVWPNEAGRVRNLVPNKGFDLLQRKGHRQLEARGRFRRENVGEVFKVGGALEPEKSIFETLWIDSPRG